MKKMFPLIAIFLVLAVTILSFRAKQATLSKEQYILLYFGATSCYYCNLPENIANINTLTKTIGQKYSDIKRVLVCMDKDIKEGLSFINKYDSTWDEISIGSFYHNELAYQYLNSTKTPGVPHIMILKRNYSSDNQFNVPTAIKTSVIIDLVGGNEINNWIQDGFPASK